MHAADVEDDAKKGLVTFEGVTEPDADDDCESDGDMTDVLGFITELLEATDSLLFVDVCEVAIVLAGTDALLALLLELDLLEPGEDNAEKLNVFFKKSLNVLVRL